MGATCAACLLPIQRLDQCTISQTEVFHRRCIGRIVDSRGNRMAQRVLELEGERERYVRMMADAQHELARARELEVRMAGAQSDVIRLNDEIRADAKEMQRRDRLHQETVQALQIAVRERDAARRELALHQIIATPERSPNVASSDADLDPTVIRFSLLELDTSD